jgi:hypothetical protein
MTKLNFILTDIDLSWNSEAFRLLVQKLYSCYLTTTTRKVGGSILTEMFHGLNLSSRTLTFGSTQPATEICTKESSWGLKPGGAYG